MMRALAILFTVLFLSSCYSDEERNLRSMMSHELSVASAEKVALQEDISVGDKYQELELKMNQAYVADVKRIVENSFHTQYEAFSDNELGIIGTFSLAFQHLFMSKQRWNEDMALKSQRYFSPINTENEIFARFEQHKSDVFKLREQLVESVELMSPEFKFVSLPDNDISLDALHGYSRNNILIDISSELLDWLIGLLVAAVLSAISVKRTKLIGFLVSCLLVGASIVLGQKNDSLLERRLAEQNEQQIEIQDGIILEELDKNTISYYEKIRTIAYSGDSDITVDDVM